MTFIQKIRIFLKRQKPLHSLLQQQGKYMWMTYFYLNKRKREPDKFTQFKQTYTGNIKKGIIRKI